MPTGIVSHNGVRYLTLPNSFGEQVAAVAIHPVIPSTRACLIAECFPSGTPSRRAKLRAALAACAADLLRRDAELVGVEPPSLAAALDAARADEHEARVVAETTAEVAEMAARIADAAQRSEAERAAVEALREWTTTECELRERAERARERAEKARAYIAALDAARRTPTTTTTTEEV